MTVSFVNTSLYLRSQSIDKRRYVIASLASGLAIITLTYQLHHPNAGIVVVIRQNTN
jgi:hypothetical protein